MDAIKFIDELNRMCKSHDDVCTGCPLIGSNCPVNDFDVEAEKVVPIVEEWVREHPVVTNGQKIVELMTGERCIERTPYCVSIHVNAEWWDAESPEHDGCKDCKWLWKTKEEHPCSGCKQNYLDKWEERDD